MNLRKTQKSLKEPFKARSALFRTRTAETIYTKKNAPKSFDFTARAARSESDISVSFS